MNLNLLDDGSRVVSSSSSSSSHHHRGRYLSRAGLRKGLLWLGRNLWKKPVLSITACWGDRSSSGSLAYHRLNRTMSELFVAPPRPSHHVEPQPSVHQPGCPVHGDDTVLVKVAILGDCQTGKTSLMQNYVAGDRNGSDVEAVVGVNSMEKLLDVHSAKIALSIWEDLGGFRQLMTPVVCKDAAAILILFDLTRRTTLHSVKQWFVTARQSNKVAVPVLVGTKFDQFIKLPENLKSLITKQARLYAQAMGAPLVFTSTPYNINVNKVFKIVLARIFDLPCKISKNLNSGEPLVDY